MPRLRALVASIIGGVLVFVALGVWLVWPMFLSVIIAALAGVGYLMLAAALGEDDESVDEAWRVASAELAAAEASKVATGERAAAALVAGEGVAAPADALNGMAAEGGATANRPSTEAARPTSGEYAVGTAAIPPPPADADRSPGTAGAERPGGAPGG